MDNKKWISLDFMNGEKAYTRLPYDPFSEPPPGKFVNVQELYFLIRVQEGVGLVSMDEKPPDAAKPPYTINLDLVQTISQVAESSPIYSALERKRSPIVQPSSGGLIVPR